MNEGISEEQKSVLWESLDTVGEQKCVGYLPPYALERFLARRPAEVKELLEKKGLVVQIFPADKCCIKSGAIYAYHRDGLERVLRENEKALVDQGWPIEPRSFIARAANEWLDNSHPIYKVVARAFDD